MNEFSAYEYAVKPKRSASLVLRRAGLIIFYMIFVILWFVFGFATGFFPLLAFIPLSLWVLIFLTWRYVCPEYEYSIVSGEITFATIYGGRSRRTRLSFKIKDCSLIAPVSEIEGRITENQPQVLYDMSCYIDSPSSYMALVMIDGKRTAVIFEMTDKALKICRFYNSAATKISKI